MPFWSLVLSTVGDWRHHTQESCARGSALAAYVAQAKDCMEVRTMSSSLIRGERQLPKISVSGPFQQPNSMKEILYLLVEQAARLLAKT
jgi:hypothetical protein